MLHEHRYIPEHFTIVTEYLTLIAVLHLVKVPRYSLLPSIIIAISCVNVHSVHKAANTTCRAETLGTLALTSTNGRACIPRRRVLLPTSAMTSLYRIVINYFDISLREAVRGPSQVANPKAYNLPCLINFCPHVLPIFGRYAISKLSLVHFNVSSTVRHHFKLTTSNVYKSTMPDTLALTSTISRACIPGRRATTKASALTSALGRACIPRADLATLRIWML